MKGKYWKEKKPSGVSWLEFTSVSSRSHPSKWFRLYRRFPGMKNCRLGFGSSRRIRKEFQPHLKYETRLKNETRLKVCFHVVCFYFSRKRRMIETIIGHNQSSHSLPDDGQVKWRVVYVVKLRFIYLWRNLVSLHLVILRTSLLVETLVYKRT